MSLQLWMPLMGDLHNQGLGTYSISTLGTLSWVAGKLGAKAMKAGDGTQIVNGVRIEDTFTTLLNGPYSVSVWIKPYGDHIHYNGSIFSSGNWDTANKRWAFGVNQTNTKVDVLCSNYNTYIDCTVPVNEWTHLVCTCGTDRIVKLYKNGEYIASLDRSEANAFDSNATFTCIGRESYASGYFSFNGAIQDFRLYSHCLSEIEIKHLAQGLILHYPLNRNGWGQENLHKNSDTITSTWSINQGTVSDGVATITPTTTSDRRIYQMPANGGWAWQSGKTYTASIDAKSPNGATLIFYPYGAGSMSQSYTVTSDWKRYTFTFTATGSGTASMTYHVSQTSGVSLQLKHPKLEEGSIATPWCPNSSDTLATTMGLNSTTEYDCSGFGNNGTRTGTFAWTSDTPKYAVSQDCIGTNYIHLTPPSTEVQTIAIWANWKTIPSGQSVILVDNGSGIGLGLMNTGILCSTSGAGSSYTFDKTSLVANTWYHFVVVKTGTTTRKLYINGVEQTAKTTTSNWTFAVNELQLGKRSTTSDGFIGKLSDFRAYATALSAEEVLSLYQNSATIDSNGVIHGQIR